MTEHLSGPPDFGHFTTGTPAYFGEAAEAYAAGLVNGAAAERQRLVQQQPVCASPVPPNLICMTCFRPLCRSCGACACPENAESLCGQPQPDSTTTCANCGDPIIPCSCGGSACPGWRHPGWGGHWCQHDKGKAEPIKDDDG